MSRTVYRFILIILLLLVNFILCSCAVKKEMAASSDIIVGVSYIDDEGTKTSIPLIDEDDYLPPNSFGPIVGKNWVSKTKRKKKLNKDPVLGIFFGPGLFRTVSYISIIRVFEKIGLRFHVISGTGLGSVVAALYANNSTSDQIEWFFYKVLNKIKDKKPYSKEWKSIILTELEKELPDYLIQEVKTTLLIPVYDNMKGEIKNLMRGNLLSAIEKNFSLSDGDKRFISSLYGKSLVNYNQMKALGTDILVGVNLLSSNLYTDENNFKLVGLFKDAGRKLSGSKHKFDYYYEISKEGSELNSISEIHKLQKIVLKNFYKSSYDLKIKIMNWKNN